MEWLGVTGDFRAFLIFALRIFARLVIRHSVIGTKLALKLSAETEPDTVKCRPIEPRFLGKLLELCGPVSEFSLQAGTDGSSVFGFEAVCCGSYALTNESAAIGRWLLPRVRPKAVVGHYCDQELGLLHCFVLFSLAPAQFFDGVSFTLELSEASMAQFALRPAAHFIRLAEKAARSS